VRSVKYEEVYLNGYENIPEARRDSPPTSTSTTIGAGTRALKTGPLTRSTGLHYGHTRQLHDEQFIT